MNVRKELVLAFFALLPACAMLSSYVEPSGPGTAQLHVKNTATEPLGIHIYEEATDCSKKRRVIWIDAGADLNIRVKAPEATAYSLNTEHMAGASVSGNTMTMYQKYCLTMFSFNPKVGGKYDITFQPVSGGCQIQASESIGGISRTLTLTPRVFVRPRSEDGAFCSPQAAVQQGAAAESRELRAIS